MDRWHKIALDWLATHYRGAPASTIESLTSLLRSTRATGHREALDEMRALDLGLARELEAVLKKKRGE
jgi:hypothetical protein